MPDTPSFDPCIHHRRSIRLRGYDYSQAGAYFVTLCAHERACLFGAVDGDVVRLNEAGHLVQRLWDQLPEYFSGIELDAFVVMPNHVHGVVVLNDLGAMNRAPTVGDIVRAYKARCTHGINRLRGMQSVSIWQRNYYEHIIRSESSLQEIREYIANNPAQWAIDRENPDAPVGARFIAPNDDGAMKSGAINRAPTEKDDKQ
ncbi:MAG: transposase [Gallionella sp.]|nr:transposase [Gallionella sp.]